ncbi:MAG TPA: hypothetical protein VFI13_11225 [Gemmatimonadales bacterium]|nr:hypothetical protein [Gemmatimonadales bacterium]
MRKIAIAALLVAAAACRPQQRERYLADQGGLLPADRFAMYGPEQAEAIAIGREMGAAHGKARGEQILAAVDYAHKLPDVVDVVVDTLGYRLQVKFKSGWIKGVVPIDDGKHGAETANLPPLTQPQG